MALVGNQALKVLGKELAFQHYPAHHAMIYLLIRNH